jgi:hypothetical protein
MTVFFSKASKAPGVAPGDLPGSIGVCESVDFSMTVGIAFEVGRIGDVNIRRLKATAFRLNREAHQF